MLAWWMRFVCILALVGVGTALPTLDLGAKDFQLGFLRDLVGQMEQRAEVSLNDYLDQLGRSPRNANYSVELGEARASPKLQVKVTLVKQLLDVQSHLDTGLEHTSVLRNLVFLSRLRLALRAAEDASTHEVRHMRLHRLCQKLGRPAPLSRSRLINEQTVGAALEQLNLTKREGNSSGIELNEFGAQLYERVKLPGAEIIDNYLRLLRSLLQDIIDGDHEELAGSSGHLDNMLQQLDAMLATEDFFGKRQRVYAYLRRHLAADYEQMRDSEGSGHFTEHLLAQLKVKGLDLFLIFLFSNFEFLELVHEHWLQLLPQTPSLLLDETARQLYDLQQLYDAFKLDTESEAKYAAYSDALRRLHERTVEQGQRNRHVFELLHNASQSVGPVTFNMIRAKCEELK
ncbi:uncharacterized protein LOC108093000 [Drosophila ficusphila]|uniref:uncharacterized protein LOC108093000 n=1 Tax=Drosophila ficusphila TaxID=30025 RepID=UPI0007E7EF27|nr:uncharacterized protein LOC108093000 [Drosophila ficusphila]